MPSEPRSPHHARSAKDMDKKNPTKGQDVTGALRRAYESTVDETVPQSLLDILSKLD